MQELPTYLVVYALALAGVLGAVLGSFVNCWAWRAMHGESVLEGRSHCTSCGHVLGPADLVPILSWVASRGRCRYCGERVSARYPATELVLALSFVAIVRVYGLSLESVELCAFACVLLFLSLTDIDDYLIPNGSILCALGIRIAYMVAVVARGTMAAGEAWTYVLSGLGVGAALLMVVLIADRVLGRESMGGGDLKLYAVAALYFGWQQMLFLILTSCALGLASTLAFLRRPGTEDAEGSRVSEPFPFGPSIALACLVTMLAGQPVVSWYLGRFF